jgi:uncharacterized OB-fold protein
MMPYLPPDLPRILPGRDDAPWWEALRRHELVIQRCAVCGTWRHPPGPVCAACHATAVRWERVSGRGRVFSFTVVHHAVHPSLAGRVPYNVVLVELPDAGRVRLVTNLIDVAPAEVQVGLDVEVVFEDLEDVTLPRFRRART